MNTEAGYIPQDWESDKLCNIVTKITDGTHRTPVYMDEGIPFLRVTDIQQDQIDWKKVKYISEQEHHELIRRCNPEIGDILYSKNGTIGIPKIIDWSQEFSIFVSLCLIKMKKTDSLIDNKYLEKYLASDSCLSQIKLRVKQSAVINFHLEEIRELFIPLPPLPEQHKIANILSMVDEHISETEFLIEKTKVLKQGMMQQLLTKGIGHTEFKDTEIGRIPVEWKVESFFSCFAKIIDFRGRTPLKLGMDWGGTIPALSASNVRMGCIDLSHQTNYGSDALYDKWMSGNEIQINDILMTMEAPLGNVASVKCTQKYILSQRVIAFRPKQSNDPCFFQYNLMSDYFQNTINSFSTGSTAKGINQKNLAKLYLPVPPHTEQQKIASILTTIDDQIDTYQTKLTSLTKLKSALMQQLLTGKTRVKI